MAAPKHNLNALKNGTRLRRLVVGELPRQLNYVKVAARRYRRALESEVIATHGEITVTNAHAIDTATAATLHCGICRWVLREKIVMMGTNDVLACSRELLKGKQTRDAAVRRLHLDAKENILDALYAPQPHRELPTGDNVQGDVEQSNATAGRVAGVTANSSGEGNQ